MRWLAPNRPKPGLFVPKEEEYGKDGGEIWVLTFDDEAEGDPPVSAHMSGGGAISTVGVEDCVGPDEIPAYVKAAGFFGADDCLEVLDMTIAVARKELENRARLFRR